MATTVAQLEARLTADTRHFDRSLSQSESKTKRFGKVIGAAAIAGGAALATGVGVGAVKAVQAASNLEESMNAVRVVFGKSSDTIKEFSEQAATKVGLSMRAFNEAVTPIGAALQNVGMSSKEAATQSINLTKRAADMASVYNTDVGTALEAIQAGLRGEADPLEKFGIGLSDAAIKAKAAEMGMKTLDGELTAQQKTQARLALFFEQSNKVAGDFGNTSGSLANQQKILRARFEDLAAKIGQALLPVATKILTWVVDMLPAISDFANSIIEKLTPSFEKVGKKAKEWFPAIVDLLKDIWTWVNDNIIPIVKDLRDIFVTVVRKIAEVIRNNEDRLRDIWDRIATAIENLWKVAKPILKLLFTEVLPRVLDTAIKAIDGLFDAIEKIIEVVKDMRDAFRDAFAWVKEKWQAFDNWITEKALTLVLAILEPFTHLPEFLGDEFQDAKARIQEQLEQVRAEIAKTKAAADKAEGPWHIKFTSNVAAVGAAIGVTAGAAKKAAGDFGSAGAFGRTSLVALGRQLQSMGFQVGEHPAFGGVAPVHVPGSYHYAGRALDINWPGGGAAEMSRLDWLYSRLRRMPGVVELLWRTAGHFDHLHVAMDKAGWHTLRPGLNIVGNYTGRPEPVYATGRGGGSMFANVNLTLDGRQLARTLVELDFKQRRTGGLGFLG